MVPWELFSTMSEVFAIRSSPRAENTCFNGCSERVIDILSRQILRCCQSCQVKMTFACITIAFEKAHGPSDVRHKFCLTISHKFLTDEFCIRQPSEGLLCINMNCVALYRLCVGCNIMLQIRYISSTAAGLTHRCNKPRNFKMNVRTYSH